MTSGKRSTNLAPNILGDRFGILTVIERRANDKYGGSRWLCRCDCGEERVINATGLRAGRHKSCGCKSPRFTSKRVTTHGMTKTRAYSIWIGMLSRCSDADAPKAHLYALKGIRVCERWQRFENFFADMGERPPGHSIDRIDSNGNYEPSNCRWATPKQQANNTSMNVKLTFNGRTQNISQWAEELRIRQNTIVYRLRRGWDVSAALTIPVQPKNRSRHNEPSNA